MAAAMPVGMPKQSERFAATLNSPPLTWILHSVALRNGTTPGSKRYTSAPSDSKPSAPSFGMLKPYACDPLLKAYDNKPLAWQNK